MAKVDFQKAPLKSPFSICIWITDVCNLSCKYCYASPFSGNIMDANRLYPLLDELNELEVFDIVFAGGEPFMHPHIFDIIEYALNSGMQVGVLSNGVALDEDVRSRLADIVTGTRKFILQISLDSADPVINDKTRGKGALTIDNLRALAQLNMQLQISCVLTKYNIESAHLIIDEFYPAIKRFHFLNIQRTEKALQMPDLLPQEVQIYKFWMRLKEHAKQFPSDLFLPSLRIMLRSYGVEESRESHSFIQQATFTCKSCSAGITHVNIDSNFNVLGCDIAKDFTRMGNVRDKSFESVWNSCQAHKVRNTHFPACYRIKNPVGKSQQDFLKPEYRLDAQRL